MSFVDFSESDLLRGKVVPPAWYKISIDSVEDWKPSKNGNSNNLVMNCTIIANADTGETEGIQGVPVIIQLNDSPKARGFIEGFLRGLGVNVEAGIRYDLKASEGKEIVAFVENETYEERVRNRINHKYRVPKN